MNSLKKFVKIKSIISSVSPINTTIIVVTKSHKIDKINSIIEYGYTEFGENRVAEAIEKWSKIKENNIKIKLHLVGRLQSNKVEDACRIFDYIHSLDSKKLASRISSEQRRIKKCIKLFIQVNIGNEIQKSGIQISEVDSFVKLCISKYKLEIIGLMCIPPINQDPIPYFKLLKQLAINNGLSELSMGMSSDYLKAIECGSTYVRIGSAIFGERN